MSKETIENNFTYHAPKGDQPRRYDLIRGTARGFAEIIDETCGQPREVAGDDQAGGVRDVGQRVHRAKIGGAMNINWKVRIRNKAFWVALIPAVLLLVTQVAAIFGIALDSAFFRSS